MSAQILFFVLQSINPIAGGLVSVPVAVLEFGWNPLLAAAAAIPLCYVQVIVVDLLWSTLCRWRFWNRLVAKRRSATIERLVTSRGAFVSTALVSPLVGPWVVMSFMRYAGVPQRTVALPIGLGITWMLGLVAATSHYAPRVIDDFEAAAPFVGAAVAALLVGVVLASWLWRRRVCVAAVSRHAMTGPLADDTTAAVLERVRSRR